MNEALSRARTLLAHAPKLVPVFGHRFLVTEPLRAGNPVLSVYQSDIIVYGNSLADDLAHEFGQGALATLR
ncbi:MAG: hypothetical protein ACOZQL_04230 [Myxococcota bacterium]